MTSPLPEGNVLSSKPRDGEQAGASEREGARDSKRELEPVEGRALEIARKRRRSKGQKKSKLVLSDVTGKYVRLGGLVRILFLGLKDVKEV